MNLKELQSNLSNETGHSITTYALGTLLRDADLADMNVTPRGFHLKLTKKGYQFARSYNGRLVFNQLVIPLLKRWMDDNPNSFAMTTIRAGYTGHRNNTEALDNAEWQTVPKNA
ncbi:hypothetical protein [Vibrio europaeus]|uniref:hypothetical protein n=1 Tax=Vibrio europaeus TaxID=300876 RepID=UPI00233E71B6|nr:hypothetical protein [Vibrio europaeus]MDC5853482.1 hypothetical protein [Vibrio europaeus]